MTLGLLPGPPGGLELARLVALALTAGAAVAVFGARRPGVAAWNFVVLGLLAVMLLPLAEHLLAGGPSLDPVRSVFLGGTLALGLLNYLPTRLAPAAVVVGLGCAWELAVLVGGEAVVPGLPADGPGWLGVALAPWLAQAAWAARRPAGSELDHLWLDFRDRFGLVWGQRLREQFDRAAVNARLPVRLSWRGLRPLAGGALPVEATRGPALATLRALVKRFLSPEA
jgi:hypothetical protein